MKTALLVLVIVAAAVAPLYLRSHDDAQLAVATQRLDQVEKDLAQAQADIGEIKQVVKLLLKRGEAAD